MNNMTSKEEKEYRQGIYDHFYLGKHRGIDVAIEKACDWIPRNIYEYFVRDRGKLYFAERDFIDDFRKEMEELY